MLFMYESFSWWTGFIGRDEVIINLAWLLGFFCNTESSGFSHPEIYNLNLTHLTPISCSVSPPPLMQTPPQIPHIPQAYLEEWVWGAWVKAELGALYSACQGCVHLETSLEKSGSSRFTFLTWPEFHYRSTPRYPKSPPEIKAGCIKKNL